MPGDSCGGSLQERARFSPRWLDTVRTRTLLVVLGFLLEVTATACRDSPTEPSALLVAVEARPALSFHGGLPSLPRLLGDHGLAGELGVVLELWSEGWRLPGEEGEALREAAYVAAAPTLARVMPVEAVDSLFASLEAWLERVAALNGGELPVQLAAVVERGRDEVAAGRQVLGRGGRTEAVQAALRASDLLRGVSSPVVAELLVRGVVSRLAVLGDSGAAPLSVRRARRLVQGARHALEAGDYDRAIRRAYYATRLLEEEREEARPR